MFITLKIIWQYAENNINQFHSRLGPTTFLSISRLYDGIRGPSFNSYYVDRQIAASPNGSFMDYETISISKWTERLKKKIPSLCEFLERRTGDHGANIHLRL